MTATAATTATNATVVTREGETMGGIVIEAVDSWGSIRILSESKSSAIKKYIRYHARVGSRRYHQFCGVAKALDLVGERWTLLLVRDLLLGGRRFSDLLGAMPGLTPNLLSSRLKSMQEAGLIEQRQLPPPQACTVYALTELGRELEPVVLALGRFGARWLTSPMADDRIDPRWAMVSLKRRYLGCPRPWTVGLFIGPLAFDLRLGGDELEVHDGAPTRFDLALRGELPGFGALLRGRASARELVERGMLQRDGPAKALADFARAFDGMIP